MTAQTVTWTTVAGFVTSPPATNASDLQSDSALGTLDVNGSGDVLAASSGVWSVVSPESDTWSAA